MQQNRQMILKSSLSIYLASKIFVFLKIFGGAKPPLAPDTRRHCMQISWYCRFCMFGVSFWLKLKQYSSLG